MKKRQALLQALCTAAFLGCSSVAPLPPKAIQLNLAGARALASGDLSTAEARLSVALEYTSRFVEAWVNLGYVELRRGNFDQARRDFEKALELNQDIPAPHHALGVLADKEGDREEAEKKYRAALRVDPGFAPSRANLARSLFARGQYENAREQFQRLREVAPEEVEGWAGEAEALLELDREAEAEDVVGRARKRFGMSPAIMLLVARQKLRFGEWAEAEAVLASLVGSLDRPRAGAAWAWMAIARVGAGDEVGASNAARAALAIDAGDGVALYALRRLAHTGTERPAGSARAPGTLPIAGEGTPFRQERE